MPSTHLTDGLAAAQFGGLPGQTERIGKHPVLGEQVGEFTPSTPSPAAMRRTCSATVVADGLRPRG